MTRLYSACNKNSRNTLAKMIILSLPLYSFALFAHQAEQVLKVGIAEIPPFTYVNKTGGAKGLEVEILNTCFKTSQYQLEYIKYPYARLPIALANKDIDAHIATAPQKNELYYSQVVAPEYRTVAIHLAKNNFKLKNIDDLYGKSIVAHQRASNYYGEKFKQVTIKNGKSYTEYADQQQQVKLLYNNLVDVIIIGEHIFEHIKNNADFQTQQAINISPILGDKKGYHNAFHSKKIRDYFNQCLAKIKTNGVYQQLVKKSLSK